MTDANVFLDRVNADYFLGGAMRLHPDESARAVGTLAAELAMEPETLAAGILSVVNARMRQPDAADHDRPRAGPA